MTLAAPVDIEDVDPWHAAQVANAKTGKRAIVRIPLVRRSVGWGCVCPNWYVGDNPVSYGGEAWIQPTFAPAVADLGDEPGRLGFVAMVEGYYTGKTEKFVWRSGKEVLRTYKIAEFHVLRRSKMADDDDFQVEVLLDGPQAKARVKPLTDDRPWLVIAHSLKLSSPSCTKGAELRRKILIEKGFKDAEVIDSRSAPLLSCCFKSVLLGRFKTRAQAKALSTVAKAKKVVTYVRRGW